jgi:hypothetical protein
MLIAEYNSEEGTEDINFAKNRDLYLKIHPPKRNPFQVIKNLDEILVQE